MNQSSISLTVISFGIAIIVFLAVAMTAHLMRTRSTTIIMVIMAGLTGVFAIILFTVAYSPYRYTGNTIILDVEHVEDALLNGNDAYKVSTVGMLDTVYVKEERINTYKGKVAPLVCDKRRSIFNQEDKVIYECSLDRF